MKSNKKKKKKKTGKKKYQITERVLLLVVEDPHAQISDPLPLSLFPSPLLFLPALPTDFLRSIRKSLAIRPVSPCLQNTTAARPVIRIKITVSRLAGMGKERASLGIRPGQSSDRRCAVRVKLESQRKANVPRYL